MNARIGELDIAYDVRGSGAPLLLIAGFGMSRVMWPEDFCDLLAAAGFCVVRMDNRETGASTRLRSLGLPNMRRALARTMLGLPFVPPYTLEDMGDDAFGLMTHLGHARFHVAGASMGGMIAQTMALTHGERLLSLTSIMSTPGGRRYAISSPRALVRLLTPAPRDPALHTEHLFGVLKVLNGDLPIEAERLRAIAVAQVATNPSVSGAARQFAAILDSSNRRRALLPRITTPTLIIHGTSDPLLPLRGARKMAKLIPGAELLVLVGMGHSFHSTHHGRIVEAITRNATK